MSTNGKGSKQRPKFITEQEMELNWERTFTKIVQSNCIQLSVTQSMEDQPTP